MKYVPIEGNFIYPQNTETHYRFGSSTENNAPALRIDGDWRDYLPQGELQMRNGIETSTCFIAAQHNAIATLIEEMYGIKDSNYSARFNLLHTDGSPQGGDPTQAGQSFRNDGLIPESMLPFSDDIKSWDDFNSYLGGDENACTIAGKLFTSKWKLNWDIVIERYNTLEDKLTKLRQALMYSPIAMSVPAWYEENGMYVRPPGLEVDNHLVLAVFMDKDYIYIFDTYEPFIKKVDININPNFAVRWTVKKIDTIVKKENWFIRLIKKLWQK